MDSTSQSDWAAGYTTTVIKFVIMTIVFIGILVAMFAMGSLNEIANNFPRYRCNPMAMPFASNFGYDTMENFNFCLNAIFKGKAAEIFGPVYGLLGGFTAVITQMVNVTAGIRTLFGNFLSGVNGFVRSVRDKIQAVLFSIKMSFAKLMNLMGRVYGTMYAVIFMGTSAMTAGFNLADNDLVKFLFEFCFAPDTPIVLHGGKVKPIKNVKIGERLVDVDGQEVYVTSTFVFDGEKTPMVDLDGIVVSSEHFVQGANGMIEAAKHPNAVTAPSIPLLYCLNVTGHKFKVGPHIFADYDEHDDYKTVKAVQNIAVRAVNGRKAGGNVDGYDLGYNPNDYIVMSNGKMKKLKEVQIGDTLFYSGKVLGIVKEQSESICKVGETYVAPATLIWHKDEWVRASRVHPILKLSSTVMNFITEGCNALHIYDKSHALYGRDYREVPLPEMEEPYREALNIQMR
jgi:hypothetical protein